MEHLYDIPGFAKDEVRTYIKELEKNLISFTEITNIPVSFFSLTSKYLWSTLPDKRVCSCNRDFGDSKFHCSRNLLLSMQVSLTLPDTYMFICDAGLINFCSPVRIKGNVYGFLMAGPSVMGNSMKRFYADFTYKTGDQNIDYSTLMPILHDMKLFSPREITHLANLFQSVVTSSLAASNLIAPEIQRQKEQDALSRELMELNKHNQPIDYPYEIEDELAQAVISGETEKTVSLFDEFMNKVKLFEIGRMSAIKLRVIAFTTRLFSENSRWTENYENMRLLEEINDAETFSELLSLGNRLMTSLAETSSEASYTGDSSIIREAVSIINLHYTEELTLKDVANEIHVNSTYLSTLFNQEMHMTFAAYLSEMRLAHAEQLLRTTNLPITEICLASGFSSSSYFSKVFHDSRGITPREYRKNLSK